MKILNKNQSNHEKQLNSHTSRNGNQRQFNRHDSKKAKRTKNQTDHIKQQHLKSQTLKHESQPSEADTQVS